jgi:hypothetical protein
MKKQLNKPLKKHVFLFKFGKNAASVLGFLNQKWKQPGRPHATKKARRHAPSLFPSHHQRRPKAAQRRSSVLHIHCLAAALTITHFKRYLFALLHILLAGALQHRRMQEDILAAIFWRHEAKAAHLVKPLDRAGDVIGRAAFIAAEFAPRRRTIAEITTRGTITKATATTTETAAATAETAAATAEITTRGTIAEITAWRTIAKAAAAATETAAAAAEITAWGTIPEITARGAIPKATTAAEFTTRRARFATAFALLQLHDPRDQAPALPVRTHFADQLVAGIWRFNA